MKKIYSIFNADRFSVCLAILAGLLLASNLSAQVTPCMAGQTGGMVWQDYDNDGIKDVTETQGVGGVTVRAYGCNGNLIGTTTTDALGQYTFGVLSPAPTVAAPIRVEFSAWPSTYKPTVNGTDGRTDVQFISAVECNVDFGLISPDDFCQTEPLIAFSCFTPGALSSNVEPSIGTFPFTATMSNQINPDVSGSTYGSIYGLAYDRVKKALYSSAFLKRHVAVGTDGLGAIYKTDYSGGVPTTSLLISVPNVGTIDRTGGNALPASMTNPSVDADAFGKIGKVGLGDIDVSADGNTLYTINLNTRSLVVISNVMTAPTINEIAIASAPTCNNGLFRPLGVKVYRGHVYVGGVCSGENGGTASDINASVHRYDPVGNTWSQVLTFDLTSPAYNHGNVVGNPNPALAQCTEWEPWADVYTERNLVENAGAGEPALDPTGNFEIVGGGPTGAEFRCRAQAMVSDIEFTTDGYMLISLMDRTGHQMGYRQHPPTGSGTSFNGGPISSNNAGDMLMAYNNSGLWTLESNASLPSGRSSVGANNNQGPGGGEFFHANTRAAHEDADAGGIAYIPGTNFLLGAILDPNTSINAFGGGVVYYDVTTGNISRPDLTIIDPTLGTTGIGKANGIGDLEALCNPVPIQIGNYVWEDTDGDGVQDPCESGISGVKVELYKKNGTLIAVTTTGSNGEYYFDDTNVDELDYANTPNTGFTGLSANTQYVIVVGKNMNQFNTTTNKLSVGGSAYDLTLSNIGEGSNPDQNDNDATLLSGLTGGGAALNGYPGYCATTPPQGSDHAFDFGFVSPVCALNVTSATPSACVPATNTYSLDVVVTYSNSPGGNITVNTSNGGTITVPATTSPQTIMLTGLTANGTANIGVTAFFVNDNTCTHTLANAYNAPAACPFCPTILCGTTTVIKN